MMKLLEDVFIRCSRCRHTFELHKEDFDIECYVYDRGENSMGEEAEYRIEGFTECPKCGREISFRISGYEYPLGAYEYEDNEIYGGDFDEEPQMAVVVCEDEFDFDEWDFDFDDIEDTVKEIKDIESKKSYAEEISNKLSNNDNQEKAREKAAQKISSDINKKIGKNIFKTAGDRIVSVYSGKNGKAKQIAAIALTATAIAGSIGAIAVAINKKKQREESKRISGKK